MLRAVDLPDRPARCSDCLNAQQPSSITWHPGPGAPQHFGGRQRARDWPLRGFARADVTARRLYAGDRFRAISLARLRAGHDHHRPVSVLFPGLVPARQRRSEVAYDVDLRATIPAVVHIDDASPTTRYLDVMILTAHLRDGSPLPRPHSPLSLGAVGPSLSFEPRPKQRLRRLALVPSIEPAASSATRPWLWTGASRTGDIPPDCAHPLSRSESGKTYLPDQITSTFPAHHRRPLPMPLADRAVLQMIKPGTCAFAGFFATAKRRKDPNWIAVAVTLLIASSETLAPSSLSD